MSNITIGVREVITLLTNIVNRFGPDHTASAPSGGSGCIYAENDGYGRLKAVCIVGQVFADLGILRATLNGYATLYDAEQFEACLLDSPLWEKAEQFGVTFTEEAKSLLRTAQATQDGGSDWGHAVTHALDANKRAALREFEKSNDLFNVTLPDWKAQADLNLAPWERELLNADA